MRTAPVFGEVPSDGRMLPRPGAYGLWERDGAVAIIQVPNGRYLPGGGVDAGETSWDALCREVREEIGRDVLQAAFLTQATQVVALPVPIAKIGAYFRMVCGQIVARPIEEDHELVWVSRAEAAQTLTHEAQRWVVSL